MVYLLDASDFTLDVLDELNNLIDKRIESVLCRAIEAREALTPFYKGFMCFCYALKKSSVLETIFLVLKNDREISLTRGLPFEGLQHLFLMVLLLQHLLRTCHKLISSSEVFLDAGWQGPYFLQYQS